MMTKRMSQGFFTKTFMLVLGLFLLLPAATVNAQDGWWRRDQNRDQNRQRQDEQRRRQEERRQRRDAERRRNNGDDDDYNRRNDEYNRRNDEYNRRNNQGTYNQGTYGGYGNRGSGNRGYGNRGYGYGNYTQSQQTALNAGYNEGVKEGRRDRSRGGYRNMDDFSAYRNASKDYNSRLGDRYEYQQYFRQGFQNGYNDGLNGY
jgi:hypothetical protein